MTEPEQPVPEPQAIPTPPVRTFDEEIAQAILATLEQIFQKYPTVVRSVGVFLDYHGTLNDANLVKGIWRGLHGRVDDPPAVSGSLMSCGRLLGQIMEQNERLVVFLRNTTMAELKNLQQVAQDLAEKEKAFRAVERTVSPKPGDSPAREPAGPADAAQDPPVGS